MQEDLLGEEKLLFVTKDGMIKLVDGRIEAEVSDWENEYDNDFNF